MRMHKDILGKQEYKLRTQIDARACINPDREVFFDIFKHISIKIHPKHVPIPPQVSGLHLNPSHSKTQTFTYPKID